jgi:hypothetical protein
MTFGDPRLPESIWRRAYEAPDGCWQMKVSLSEWGYGRIKHEGRQVMVHRLAYEAFVGPIPEGLVIDHLCRNRGCINPDHLEAVTESENIRRGTSPTAANARKTHCKHGHEFTPENTYLKGTWRICRICQRAYYRQHIERVGRKPSKARLAAKAAREAARRKR